MRHNDTPRPAGGATSSPPGANSGCHGEPRHHKQQPAPIEPDQVLSLAPKRYPYVVTLNASEHTGRGVTLVSTTDDFIRGLRGTTAERFRPPFRRDP
jgi:hypothetical protein